MNHLKKGNYYGSHKRILRIENLLITETEYTYNHVDWHYHENAYFTYLIQGGLFETNKKNSYELTPGTLIFHNWQDAHFITKPQIYTQGFHLEIEASWFSKYSLPTYDFEGSLKIENVFIKELFDKVYLESKINDDNLATSIDQLLLNIFSQLTGHKHRKSNGSTKWPRIVAEILQDISASKIGLLDLSKDAEITPVHLSREFPKYFGSSFGEYLRRLKIDKACSMLKANQSSMTEIAFQCGFSDQSHFIRNFKSQYKITPLKYRNLIRGH